MYPKGLEPIVVAAIALAKNRTKPGNFRSMSTLENTVVDAVLEAAKTNTQIATQLRE